MADAKVSALDALTAVTGDDLLYVVDDPGGTPASKKATAAVLRDYTGMAHVAITDAAVTMAVNTLYVGSIAGFTADRTYTLPTTAAVGDRIGIMLTAGDDAYELLITAGTSDTLNGVAGGTEWSRLFITGEVVILRCVTADSAWVVEYDGRIPCGFYARCTTAATGNEGVNTLVVPTTLASFVWTADSNVGTCFDASTSRMTARRAGRWSVAGVYQTAVNLGVDKYCSLSMPDGTNAVAFVQIISAIDAVGYASGAGLAYPAAVGSYIEYQFRTQEGGRRISTGARFNGIEALI